MMRFFLKWGIVRFSVKFDKERDVLGGCDSTLLSLSRHSCDRCRKVFVSVSSNLLNLLEVDKHRQLTNQEQFARPHLRPCQYLYKYVILDIYETFTIM